VDLEKLSLTDAIKAVATGHVRAGTMRPGRRRSRP
jgi:hypothetical protein